VYTQNKNNNKKKNKSQIRLEFAKWNLKLPVRVCSTQTSNQPCSLLCLRKSPRLSWKPKAMPKRNNSLAETTV